MTHFEILEPSNVISDDMVIVAAGTRHDDDSLLVGRLGKGFWALKISDFQNLSSRFRMYLSGTANFASVAQ